MITYNLNDYTNILLNNPNISLSDDVLSVYKTLVSNLNITTVTSTSSVRTDTETRDRRGGYRRNKNTKRSDLLTSDKVVEFKQRPLVDEDGPEKLMITIKASSSRVKLLATSFKNVYQRLLQFPPHHGHDGSES